MKKTIEIADLYSAFFPGRGEIFQTLHDAFFISEDKTLIHATYNCDNKETRCIDEITDVFLSSPLGNDACLQVTIFLSRLNNGIGRFPVGVRKIKFYQKPSLVRDVDIYAKIKSITDEETVFDIISATEGVCVHFYDAVAGKSPYQKVLTEQERDLATLFQNIK